MLSQIAQGERLRVPRAAVVIKSYRTGFSLVANLHFVKEKRPVKCHEIKNPNNANRTIIVVPPTLIVYKIIIRHKVQNYRGTSLL